MSVSVAPSLPVRTGAGVVPGLLLAGSIAVAATALHRLPVVGALSPMILAMLLGILVGYVVGVPERARAGVQFGIRRVLRWGVVLLGLQLTVQQLAAIGGRGVAIVAVSLLATFLVTKLAGRLLGVDRKLAELIAAGTSVCGASAVIAVNTVTRGSEEDVAYAVACVTVFGTVAMFSDPPLGTLLGLHAADFGLWAGASIHEVAQVVASAFQRGPNAGDVATVAKLTRVAMLAPLVLGLAVARGKGSTHAGERAPMPMFVLGFLLLIGINSTHVLPAASTAAVRPVTTFLLTLALGAMGLQTHVGKLRAKGLRPLLLGAFSSLFISALSLLLITLGTRP